LLHYAGGMRSHPSPTAEGFRALVSAPAAFVAELVWRWIFGVAAIVIALWSLNRFLNAIVISPADEVALATGFPMLVMSAVGHIVGQMPAVGFRLASVLLPGLSLLWVVAASAGRTASIQRLLEFFGERYRISASPPTPRIVSVAMLHFIRVVIVVAAVAGYFGALMIAAQVARSGEEPSIARFLVVFVPLEFVIAMIASWLNWIVSLAPIFAVRDGRYWLESLGDAVLLSRKRAASFSRIGIWFGFLRFVIAGSFGFAGLVAIGVLGSVSGWAVLIAVVLIYGIFSIISDALLTARLAAYVAIAQQDIVPDEIAPEPVIPEPSWLRPLPPALPPAEA
jgi:hypothetical protein